MPRLSRLRYPRATLAIAIVLWFAFEAASLYLLLLNTRITRELVSGNWREPTVIVSAAGDGTREITRLYGVDWRPMPPVSIATLPPYVGNAFVAAEDVRFRHHPGVDPIGMARALVTDIRSRGIAQGGSTIDQQIVKARFLTQERTWRRKIVEIPLALILDFRLSKDEVLDIYLNDVYLGHAAGKPVLGIDEASRLYFGKAPSRLRPDEAAVLAGMVRAPNRDTPDKRPDLVRARRDAILQIMRDHGWIDDQQYRDARSREVEFDEGTIPQAPYPFYLRALRSEIVSQVGVEPVIEGGLRIVCEMDPRAQAAAEKASRRGVAQLLSRYSWLRDQSEPLQVAVLSVDPRNGGIRALVGGSNFNLSPFDRTASMRRQPGSSFKTFAYTAAIASRKATVASLLLDERVSIPVEGGKEWQPHNYDERYRGRVTVREAFEESLNVPTVRLTQDVGLGRVVKSAETFGFQERFADIPALPLGVIEVTMRELTAAYTVFPTLGLRAEPYLVRDVRNARGKVLMSHDAEQKRVIGSDVAYVMHTLLRGVVQRGTARRLQRYGLDYVAGKTGTTSDYRDAWFVGYTPDMVTSVWLGFDHGEPLRLSSGEAAVPIWGAYMSAIPHLTSQPAAPAGVTFRDIDPDTGLLWSEDCPGPWREVFLNGTAPTHHCPSGMIGRIVRSIFFDRDRFGEPPAISLEQFRQWANEVDRERQQVESGWDKLKRIFGQ